MTQNTHLYHGINAIIIVVFTRANQEELTYHSAIS